MEQFEVYVVRTVKTPGTIFVGAASFAEAEKAAYMADEDNVEWKSADLETEIDIHQITKQ